jgi:hypothetical protein
MLLDRSGGALVPSKVSSEMLTHPARPLESLVVDLLSISFKTKKGRLIAQPP